MLPVNAGFWVIVGLIVLGTFTILSLMAKLYRKVGPNQALIVYGLGGTRVFSGRGALVWPMVQSARELSLELMSFDVAPQQDLYTKEGVGVTVEAVAQIKVKSDHESILTAAEQFLSKSPEEREGLIRLVMEGHLRGIVGQLTVESIVKDPETISQSMRNTCAEDLNKMGLDIVSFTIREIRDKNEYIVNMGKPDIARIKKDADIAAAEALRDTEVKRAAAMRDAAVAKAMGDQERGAAGRASLAQHAEGQQELHVKRAGYETVGEAEGHAEGARTEGAAGADVIRLRGTAEAQIILAKGQSEAEAMKVKAAAFHEYNQAAVLDKLLTGMPEVVRAMAEPLSKVDKITIVSTGDGHGAGASKIVADVATMIAQAPALFETLAGVKLGDLLSRIPALRAVPPERGEESR